MSAKKGLKKIEKVIGRIKKDISDLASGVEEVGVVIVGNTESVVKREAEFLSYKADIETKNTVLTIAVENAVSIKENLEKSLGL